MNTNNNFGSKNFSQEGFSPRHIAIIMDGNGRWAQEKGLPRLEGHRRGALVLENVVEILIAQGLPFLTVYAFSSENWKRPEEEIGGLVNLMRFYLQNKIAKLHEQGVRLNILGEYKIFPEDVVLLIQESLELTRYNKGLTLSIALNYGGRSEIVRAAQRISKRVMAGDLEPEALTEELFSHFLWTAGIPDPEILIRTSGEQRLSNFLLWQSSYTELIFLKKYWPDFSEDDVKNALDHYHEKHRRFGGL